MGHWLSSHHGALYRVYKTCLEGLLLKQPAATLIYKPPDDNWDLLPVSGASVQRRELIQTGAV